MAIEKYHNRSHMCGVLRESDIGSTVTLYGWVQKRRDLGGLIFIDLRDRTGIIQIICDQDISKQAFMEAEKIGSEYVVTVRGKVERRTSENPNMPTGTIEVYAETLNIINEAQTPPIYIKDDDEVSESLRLKYRYLDLRKPSMQANLLLRQKISNFVRFFLSNEAFIEVETPVLTKPTPEGARDYLVPSRVNAGKFYALPQSPQLFKQLLMVSGLDRYFQIVKCFRDEDLRADRQPEFTQIDCEMSFVNQEDVIELNSRMLKKMLSEIKGVELSLPFPRLTYKESMEKYGSDKPDLRFGMELIDLSDLMANCGFKVFSDTVNNEGQVKCIKVEGKAENLSRKDIGKLEDIAKTYGAKGLAWMKVEMDNDVNAPIKKFFSSDEIQRILQKTEAENGDILLFVADKPSVVAAALGHLRVEIANKFNLYDKNTYQFVWITDFPLLEYDEETKRYVAMHHPFTSPVAEDIEKLTSDPANVKAQAYDIVLNGYEIGGGSIRIHSSDLQSDMFKALGFTEEETREKFGFLLDAFQYGTPPHGGIAFGLDRLAMILAGEENIRQVIAFPKTQNATCPLTDAPSTADQKQLQELYIKTDLPSSDN
ncbi:aspartyl-tRNA synthetase [Tindallia magadiensis]|uniref:Aspartate--tRNA ligase n=1 Tax=Tindallia magadiensis TaxID=69895 RepID=A0A1I3AA00_9FIRM|nr:aspartate--tRNA ligase [Tindallia magadiensis]SFH46943.1 aspartyl-tRNA synthetase [Tindallia magadiensis]